MHRIDEASLPSQETDRKTIEATAIRTARQIRTSSRLLIDEHEFLFKMSLLKK